MNAERKYKEIGADFARSLLNGPFGGAVTKIMNVVRVDDTFAYCRVYYEDDPLPVPLSFMQIGGTVVKVKPAIDSTVCVAFGNGASVRPFFVGYSVVDQIDVTVGESTVQIIDGTIRINGGDLGGLVQVNELTQKLNALVQSFNSFVGNYNLHIHGGNGASPTVSTAQQAQQFNKDDYENDKILQ